MQELTADNPRTTKIACRGGHRVIVARLDRAPELMPAERKHCFGPIGCQSISENQPIPAFVCSEGRQLRRALRLEPLQRRTLRLLARSSLPVHAAGANFSDVLKVMGLYPGLTDPIIPLGIEASGSRHGGRRPDVTRFRVGDELLGVVPYQLRFTRADRRICADAQAERQESTIGKPLRCRSLSSRRTHALCKLAHLAARRARADSPPGAGGVGLAAIQIAQHLGAEVFSTAGSDDKRAYLRRSRRSNMYISTRTLDFADRIMDITRREGVDVVLNSLPGEMRLPKSLNYFAGPTADFSKSARSISTRTA